MKRVPHALVVGGTRGIGRAVVRRFEDDGFRVSVVGRRLPGASDRSRRRVRHWSQDVRDHAALPALVEQIVDAAGPLDRLVCLQRFRGEGDSWVGEIETSLTATRALIDAVTSRFAGRGDRSIVAVSSVADRYVASEQPLSYHVGKAGLTQLLRYYGVTLGRLGIRVNGVASGTIVKAESRRFYREQTALRRLYEGMIPLGRMGQAEEIAAVVSFLGGREASFITGQTVVVDGGVSLQWHESLVRQLSPVKDLPVTREQKKGRR